MSFFHQIMMQVDNLIFMVWSIRSTGLMNPVTQTLLLSMPKHLQTIPYSSNARLSPSTEWSGITTDFSNGRWPTLPPEPQLSCCGRLKTPVAKMSICHKTEDQKEYCLECEAVGNPYEVSILYIASLISTSVPLLWKRTAFMLNRCTAS